MSIHHLNEVLDDPNIKVVGNPLVCLMLVAIFSDAPVTTTTIARAARLETSAARKHLRLLKQMGWIDQVGPFQDGDSQTSQWRLRERI
jgi:DNA-binding IclR family transcriptional regulator